MISAGELDPPPPATPLGGVKDTHICRPRLPLDIAPKLPQNIRPQALFGLHYPLVWASPRTRAAAAASVSTGGIAAVARSVAW